VEMRLYDTRTSRRPLEWQDDEFIAMNNRGNDDIQARQREKLL